MTPVLFLPEGAASPWPEVRGWAGLRVSIDRGGAGAVLIMTTNEIPGYTIDGGLRRGVRAHRALAATSARRWAPA